MSRVVHLDWTLTMAVLALLWGWNWCWGNLNIDDIYYQKEQKYYSDTEKDISSGIIKNMLLEIVDFWNRGIHGPVLSVARDTKSRFVLLSTWWKVDCASGVVGSFFDETRRLIAPFVACWLRTFGQLLLFRKGTRGRWPGGLFMFFEFKWNGRHVVSILRIIWW